MLSALKHLTNKRPRTHARRRALRRNFEQLEKRQLLAADIEFSTFFPSSEQEDGVAAIAQDSAGNAYVADYSYDSVTFEIESSVSKLSPDGRLLWSQSLDEYAYDLAVDDAGLVYLVSATVQDNLPTTSDAYQSGLAGETDFHVMVLDGNAIDADSETLSEGELVYASYLGGTGTEGQNSIGLATDADGGIYLAGETYSTDFPVTSQAGVDSSLGGDRDGVVAHFARGSSGGYSLSMSSYLGGSEWDSVRALAVDAMGTIHVAGATSSDDLLITSDAYQATNMSSGGFVARFTKDAELIYGSYFPDNVGDIAADETGNTYLIGRSGREGFPVTEGAYAPPEIFAEDGLTRLNGNYVSKIATTGELEHSSCYQLSEEVNALTSTSITVDGNRPVVTGVDIGGPTRSVHMLRFAEDFSGLLDNSIVSVETSSSFPWISPSSVIDGHVYVVGSTSSSDFETTADALFSAKSTGADGYVRRYSFSDLLPPTITPQVVTLDEGVSAGAAFAVMDGHAGSPDQTLTFSITGGNAAGAFGIDAATGKVTLDNPGVLDFTSYEPTVLTITVTDDQSPPQSNSATLSIQPFEPVQLAADTFDSRRFDRGEGWIESQWQTTNYTYIVDGYNDDGHNYAGTMLQNHQGLLERSLDTSEHESLKLSYWTKLKSLENGDRGLVQVSSDGVNWQTIRSHENGEDDDTWRFQEIEFNTPGDRTYIRFDADMSQSGRWWWPNHDYWYVDEIVVEGISLSNRVPDTNADPFLMEENSVLTVGSQGVLANDADPDGDPITASLASTPGHGSVSLSSDGSFVYTPDTGFAGTDTFSYVSTDGELSSLATLVTIHVLDVPDNDPPNTGDDLENTNEDQSLTVAAPGVLSNDSDPEGQSLTALLVAGPANGILELNADGSFVYTPDQDYFGSDTFTYVASDGISDSSPATVNIEVAAVNDAPVAADDSITTSEDQPVNIAVLLNDADVDGDTLMIASTEDGDSGTVAIDPNGTLTYTPEIGFFGNDSFAYTIDDGKGGSATATVMVTVEERNDPPAANDDSATTDEDTPITIDVLGNDTDPENETLSIVSLTQPTSGVATLNGGQIEYSPDPNFNGTDSFTYTIEDAAGQQATATVSLSVATINDAPEVIADSATMEAGTAVTIDVLANDADLDGDTLTAELVSSPSHGSLTLGTDSSFTYTPTTGFSGSDSFEYRAVDPAGATSQTVTVSLTVAPVNLGPNLSHGVVDDVTGAWQTVNFGTSYDSAIIVGTPQYDDNSGPGVVRIRNVTSSTFDVRVDDVGNSPFSGNVHYIAIEEGVYDEPGFKLEAVKVDSTQTSHRRDWRIDTIGYAQSYSNPVVVGQVMSVNDEDWSVFWASSGNRTSPANSGALNIGKHVGEDSDTTRATETLGYFVIEATQNGTIEGLPFVAGVGGDSVRGVGNGTFGYSYTAMPNAKTAVLSTAGMDGADGGWAVLRGDNALPASSGTIRLAIDEDQRGDRERKHSTEQVAYLVIDPPAHSDPMDVSGDGRVTSLDALQIINRLSRQRVAEGESRDDHGRLDLNGDGSVSALDALLVINHLNRSSGAKPTEVPMTPTAVDQVWSHTNEDDEDRFAGIVAELV